MDCFIEKVRNSESKVIKVNLLSYSSVHFFQFAYENSLERDLDIKS